MDIFMKDCRAISIFVNDRVKIIADTKLSFYSVEGVSYIHTYTRGAVQNYRIENSEIYLIA